MINSRTSEYYRNYCGVYIIEYLKSKRNDTLFNCILLLLSVLLFLFLWGISAPILAGPPPNKAFDSGGGQTLQTQFENKIKIKYKGSIVTFPEKGIAHIKKVKYINSKPIKINIVEINTNVNKNLRIKPQTASNYKLNHRTTVRRIAQRENSIIAINAGFFKPQTGVPLGALMIDGEVLTGPIFNRVGLVIYENGKNTTYKLSNINFNINAIGNKIAVHIDNINQPRISMNYTLLYTPKWGEYSPVSPTNCYNMHILNNKIVKISANPIPLTKDSYVIQAPKNVIKQLAQNDLINIQINLPDEIKEATHIIGAGPYLVKNSSVYVDYKEQKFASIAGKNPRSAVGFTQDNSLVIVTIDGREKASVGMTLYELASLMKSIGCTEAMNFDGGSSSALFVKNKIVNHAINKEGAAISNALTVNLFSPDEFKISSAN